MVAEGAEPAAEAAAGGKRRSVTGRCRLGAFNNKYRQRGSNTVFVVDAQSLH